MLKLSDSEPSGKFSKLCDCGFKTTAFLINSANPLSCKPLSIADFKSTEHDECKQLLKWPSDASLNLLQEGQNELLMGKIKPILPQKPSILKTFAVPVLASFIGVRAPKSPQISFAHKALKNKILCGLGVRKN